MGISKCMHNRKSTFRTYHTCCFISMKSDVYGGQCLSYPQSFLLTSVHIVVSLFAQQFADLKMLVLASPVLITLLL